MDFSISTAQEAFLEAVRAFVRDRVSPEAARIDETATFPRGLVDEAARLSLTGVTIPKELGGGGHDTVAYAMAMEAVSFGSATLAVILSVNNSLVAEPIRCAQGTVHVGHRPGLGADPDPDVLARYPYGRHAARPFILT